jgi:hypothetical protein
MLDENASTYLVVPPRTGSEGVEASSQMVLLLRERVSVESKVRIRVKLTEATKARNSPNTELLSRVIESAMVYLCHYTKLIEKGRKI